MTIILKEMTIAQLCFKSERTLDVSQFINFSEKPISEKFQIFDSSKNLTAFVDLLPRQAFSFEPQYVRHRIFLQLQDVSPSN